MSTTALPYFVSAIYLYRNEIGLVPWIFASFFALVLIGIHAYSVSPFAKDFKIRGAVPILFGVNESLSVRKVVSSSGAKAFAIRVSWRTAADKTTALLAALVMTSILPIVFYNFPNLEYHQHAYMLGTTLSLIAVGALGLILKHRTVLAGCVLECVPILTPASGRNAFTQLAPNQTLTRIRRSAAAIERAASRIDKADRVIATSARRSDSTALRQIATELNTIAEATAGTSEAARRRARVLVSDAIGLIIGAADGTMHEAITSRHPMTGKHMRHAPDTRLARFWRSLNQTNPEVISTIRWLLGLLIIAVLMALGLLGIQELAAVFS